MEDLDQTLKPGEDPLQGSVLAGFEILRKLGEGAMGIVYLARQVSLERDIALKILPPSPAVMQGDNISRFMREARTAASLSHVNIVQIHDAGEYEGLYFIAMEYVPGLGFSDVLKGLGKLSEAASLEIALQTAQGLGAAADRGIIHRDIKPANLMLTPKAVVKVADFGLAKSIGQTASGITATGRIVGTPSYMSPEQAESKPGDLRSDMFSLGVTLFESLTGEKPFVADSVVGVLRLIVDQPTPDPREIEPDLSEDTASVVARMLEKDPGDRHQDYSDLIQDLLMAKRGLDHPGGELETVKAFIQSELSVRENLPLASGGGLALTAAQTLKLKSGPTQMGVAGGQKPEDKPPPRPAPGPKPEKTVPAAVSSRKTSKAVLAAGGMGVAALVVAVVFLALSWNKTDAPGPEATGTSAPFELNVTAPVAGQVVAPGPLEVEGRIRGTAPDTIRILGEKAWIEGGRFGATVTVDEETGALSISASGAGGYEEDKRVPLEVDGRPPALQFENRVREGRFYTMTEEFSIMGRLADDHPAQVRVQGVPVEDMHETGRFRFVGTLPSEGSRVFRFEGLDKAGNAVEAEVEVVRDSTPPDVRISGLRSVILSAVPDHRITVYADEPLRAVIVDDAVGGETEIDTGGAEEVETTVVLAPGRNVLRVTGEDLAGNRYTLKTEVEFQNLQTDIGRAKDEKIYERLQNNLRGKSDPEKLDMLRIFMASYLESPHAADARAQIDRLEAEAERKAWEKVEGSASGSLDERIEAIEAYLDGGRRESRLEWAREEAKRFKALRGDSLPPVPAGRPDRWTNPTDGAALVRIHPGTYALPGPPARRVDLSAFYLYAREVTQAQFAAFLTEVGGNEDENGRPLVLLEGHPALADFPFGFRREAYGWAPARGRGEHPAVYVTWFGARAYARWAGGRLPTEAQWEAAARAGSETPYFWGGEMDGSFAWYRGNSENRLHAAGKRKPNAFGLFDMLGNAWEWCLDDFDERFPSRPGARQKDPVCLETTGWKALRGGSWDSPPHHLRLSVRTGLNPLHAGPSIGFRVAIPAPER